MYILIPATENNGEIGPLETKKRWWVSDMMKRRQNVGKKWFMSSAIALSAAFLMAGIYYMSQRPKGEIDQMEVQQETAKQEKEPQRKEHKRTQQENKDADKKEAAKEQEERVQTVADMIRENKQQEQAEGQPEPAGAEAEEVAKASETDPQEALASAVIEPEPQHFSEKSSLTWPVQGEILLDYSMDATVYFQTLQQYKYNPAMIIRANVNDPVMAAAGGTVVSVQNQEETGCTMTVDLGDGYQAIYGQLKEVQVKEGDVLQAGQQIGYISEPAKYYSVEGSNLYFQLKKDGGPIDPRPFLP